MQLEALRIEALRELKTRDDEIGRLRAELDAGSAECVRLMQIKSDNDREIQRLRTDLMKAATMPLGKTADATAGTSEITSLIAALPPMMWGLERAVEYLEPFAKTETMLDAHVRQLSLLRSVLKKLVEISPQNGG
jgi:hypothetical protein